MGDTDIPAEWFPTWPHPDYGPRLRREHSGLVMFYKDSTDEPCACGGTLRFLGYLYGCLGRDYDHRCGYW